MRVMIVFFIAKFETRNDVKLYKPLIVYKRQINVAKVAATSLRPVIVINTHCPI